MINFFFNCYAHLYSDSDIEKIWKTLVRASLIRDFSMVQPQDQLLQNLGEIFWGKYTSDIIATNKRLPLEFRKCNFGRCINV